MNFLKKIRDTILGINDRQQYMFWYRYKGETLQNFGDLIGPYLFKTLSDISVKHIEDKPALISSKHIPHYLTVGSIVSFTRKSSIVWGSGIIKKNFGFDENATYLAVRGPKTRAEIITKGGICPEIYGDPALLLPLLSPSTTKKNARITIIPHYVDYEDINNSLRGNDVDVVEMMTSNFSRTLDEIKSSNFIISSSLHGLVLAVAYNIPCLWAEFSDKIFGDDIKYYDFFSSLGIISPKKCLITDLYAYIDKINQEDAIQVSPQIVYELQQGLLNTYPFSINKKVIDMSFR